MRNIRLQGGISIHYGVEEPKERGMTYQNGHPVKETFRRRNCVKRRLNKKSPALKEIFICRVNPRETDQDLEIYQNYSPVRRIRLNNKLYAA